MRYVRYLIFLIVIAAGSIFLMVSAYNKARAEAIDQLYQQEKMLAYQARQGISEYLGYFRQQSEFIASLGPVARMDKDEEPILRQLYETESNSMASITRVRLDGKIAYTYPETSSIGKDVFYQEHVQLVFATKKPVVSKVFRSVQGFDCIALHVPIFDRGRFNGSLAVLIPFDRIARRYLNDIRIGNTGYAQLLSAEGIELYCPFEGHTGKPIFENAKGDDAIGRLASQMLSGGESRYSYSSSYGTNKLTKYRAYMIPIPVENTMWSLCVTAPEDEGLRFISGFINRWTTAMVALVAVFILWAVSLYRAYQAVHRDELRRAAEDRVNAAKREVEESQALLAAAIAHSSSGILIAEAPSGKIMAANNAALAIRGGDPSKLVGITADEHALRWNTRKADGTPYPHNELPLARAIFRGETTINEELMIVNEDGNQHWISANAAPIKNQEGAITAAVVVFQDITEGRLAEERIRELNAELERRVYERTMQLEESNKELESFAYSVSHDLRAPVRHLDGFSQILLDDYGDILDSRGREYLVRIGQSAQRMGDLIDSLLSLSRLSRADMTKVKVDLSKIAQEIAENLRESGTDRKVEFVIAPGLTAKADNGLIRVVLDNIMRNAWKFTSKTENAVIEFGSKKEGRTKVFFIKDNGAGFNMEYADKLFGVFQRLHSTTEFGGTGIGLATVNRIVRRHGGKVWAEGKVGAGATFYFTLP